MIVLTVLLAGTTGCAGIGFLNRGKVTETPSAAPTAVSPLDSLWRSGAPVDTVSLQPRSAVDSGIDRGTVGSLRLAPAAVAVGLPDRVMGYRVQLASSSSREELERLASRVEREFSTRSYLERSDSGYTMRIGSFTDRGNAESEKARAVSFGYRHAWIVQTEITPGEDRNKE